MEERENERDIVYPGAIPFIGVHLLCLAAFWTGIHLYDLMVCVGLYYVRMFGVTAGYHRYFAHRTFKTSRIGQFLLGWLAQTSLQQGILWWAACHRHHHKHSDKPDDIHSPRHHGMAYAHVGWIFDRQNAQSDQDLDRVKDLSRYPELVWLNRHKYLPGILLALGTWLALGWSGLVVGFFWSTVLLWHGTFTINSLSHGLGRERYYTGDDSKNNWFLATFVSLGEGWHNNHHYFQSSTRQGFRAWEFDFTYYGLRGLSRLGCVWDLNEPPREVLLGLRGISSTQVDRAEFELSGLQPFQKTKVRQSCDILIAAANESPPAVSVRARAALTRIAHSMSPCRLEAQEAWQRLIDQAREHLWKAQHRLDDYCEHRLTVLREALESTLTPLSDRAREILRVLAYSTHPLAGQAQQILSVNG